MARCESESDFSGDEIECFHSDIAEDESEDDGNLCSIYVVVFSLSYAGPSRMIQELKGILPQYAILTSFNQPDYKQLHALTTTLDINILFTHQS